MMFIGFSANKVTGYGLDEQDSVPGRDTVLFCAMYIWTLEPTSVSYPTGSADCFFGWSVRLSIHFHIFLRLRMCKNLPPPTLPISL